MKTDPGLAQRYSACIDFRSEVLPACGLVFNGFERIEQASVLAEVIPCLERVQRAAQDGYYAVGFVAYEAAAAFDPALRTHETDWPLAFFGLAKTPAERPLPAGGPFRFTAWSACWSEAEYLRAFDRVQEHLEAGDSYQVNLTFPLHARFSGSVSACYEQLRQAQAANFSGLITGPDRTVISASPELFFERRGPLLRVRPMKGTRRRGRSAEEDLATAEELHQSVKDRAENVMIVDLLRNDLGRLAAPGSVSVKSLFNIERFPTVWQMTSEVEARVGTGAGLADIFGALFPCGSVTGAPKVKTMDIIEQLEVAPRNVYCGAFGVVAPGGDCVFNVPIRTLALEGPGRNATYHVGSGVVADSHGPVEYAECLLKARVLEPLPGEFELVETMLWQPGEGVTLLDAHLERLAGSARYFGYSLEREVLCKRLDRAASQWHDVTRVRLLLSAEGDIRVEAEPCSPIRGPATIKLAEEPVDSSDPFLYHKTTHRYVYDRERARLGGADDAILYNERGEITESTIANVAVRLGGEWCTPPVSCGLLPGIQRARLLAQGTLIERVITVEEARQADEIQLFNAVRGCYPVTWC